MKTQAQELHTSTLLLIQNGFLVSQLGSADRKFEMNSIRKSLIGILIGKLNSQGSLSLDQSLLELGIDDFPTPLSELEKTATIRDLLTSRSGVYIEPVSETTNMKQLRPPRGSHRPGKHFYYNNWSFNALLTVVESVSQNGVFDLFSEQVAQPLGMQDFEPTDGRYLRSEKSMHPGYFFRMSARDVARVGLLYSRKGFWQGKTVLPSDWISLSTKPYSDTGAEGGYGFLWWTEVDGRLIPGVRVPSGSYLAQGFGGQFMLVIPECDLILINFVETKAGHDQSIEDFGKIVKKALEAYKLI
jgi:CubicO group peptidase (beta-lactamase class C family)